MIHRTVLDQIPYKASEQVLMDMVRIRVSTRHAIEFSEIFTEALSIAKPRAIYATVEAPNLAANVLNIEGIELSSSLFCMTIADVFVVFPFIATCGVEIEAWSLKFKQVRHLFWANAIMLTVLASAVKYLEDSLSSKVGDKPLSSINPGSLPEWPVEEQAKIFAILGKDAASAGIKLTKDMTLCPQKSVSGIYFMSENGFCNCSLCLRDKCFSRRAPHMEKVRA